MEVGPTPLKLFYPRGKLAYQALSCSQGTAVASPLGGMSEGLWWCGWQEGCVFVSPLPIDSPAPVLTEAYARP